MVERVVVNHRAELQSQEHSEIDERNINKTWILAQSRQA